MSDAKLLYRIREAFGRGFIEAVIWELPEPAKPSTHLIRYRLVYIVQGERVVGYDNERGKGDHRHIVGRELAYTFVDVPTLLADFLKDAKEHE